MKKITRKIDSERVLRNNKNFIISESLLRILDKRGEISNGKYLTREESNLKLKQIIPV